MSYVNHFMFLSHEELCSFECVKSDVNEVIFFLLLLWFPHVPPLSAVKLCLSACSSWMSSDSSVAAASFCFSASVSRCTAPPCWTVRETKKKQTKKNIETLAFDHNEAKFQIQEVA